MFLKMIVATHSAAQKRQIVFLIMYREENDDDTEYTPDPHL